MSLNNNIILNITLNFVIKNNSYKSAWIAECNLHYVNVFLNCLVEFVMLRNLSVGQSTAYALAASTEHLRNQYLPYYVTSTH